MDIPNQILEYEQHIFDEYISKRIKFIKSIKELNINKLNKTQLSNMINDIKMIIDPLKNIINNIDDYLENNIDSFNNDLSTRSLIDFDELIKYYILLSSLNDSPDSLDSLVSVE